MTGAVLYTIVCLEIGLSQFEVISGCDLDADDLRWLVCLRSF